MKQFPSPEKPHKQAVPVIRGLVKIQIQHYGIISIDTLIYAMVKHLAHTIAAVRQDSDDYREWINTLMDQFRHVLEQEPKATDDIPYQH